MKNMKLPPPTVKEEKMEAAIADRPEYPYGLQINLNEDSLEALGMGKLPKVGTKMILTAKVVVNSVSENANMGGNKYQSVSLQITDMELGADKEKQDVQKKLYGE